MTVTPVTGDDASVTRWSTLGNIEQLSWRARGFKRVDAIHIRIAIELADIRLTGEGA